MRWSQEALAAAASLTPRTIQRIEAGEKVSVSTRRSLARGLGYEDPDVFEDPEFVANLLQLLDGMKTQKIEDYKASFPEHLSLPAKRVERGNALAKMAGHSQASVFHCDDDVSPDAQAKAADLFDYLRDLIDIWDECSYAHRLEFTTHLESRLRDLEDQGARIFMASRAANIVGSNWGDKTPVPMKIGYLAIVPQDKELTELMVPKRLS